MVQDSPLDQLVTVVSICENHRNMVSDASRDTINERICAAVNENDGRVRKHLELFSRGFLTSGTSRRRSKVDYGKKLV